MESKYNQKYLKYKQKYLELLQRGGTDPKLRVFIRNRNDNDKLYYQYTTNPKLYQVFSSLDTSLNRNPTQVTEDTLCPPEDYIILSNCSDKTDTSRYILVATPDHTIYIYNLDKSETPIPVTKSCSRLPRKHGECKQISQSSIDGKTKYGYRADNQTETTLRLPEDQQKILLQKFIQYHKFNCK